MLATKVSVPMDEDPNHRGNSRRWIITEVENSLRRLGTDWIDLYQIDEIVKPGVIINPADTSYGEQVLEPSLRRR